MKYLKLYLDEIAMWQEELTMERTGYLLVATASYMRDGSVMEVPDTVRFAFADQRRKADHSLAVYNSKVENGRSGGKAKAANAAKKSAAAAFKAPNLKQFHATVRHYLDTGDIEEAKDYDVDVFFDRLKESGWKIGEEPIAQRSDWESAILARFGPAPQPFTRQQYYSVFERIFSTLHAQRDGEGRSQADDIAYSFFEAYDEAAKAWDTGGEKLSGMSAALDRFLERYAG